MWMGDRTAFQSVVAIRIFFNFLKLIRIRISEYIITLGNSFVKKNFALVVCVCVFWVIIFILSFIYF